MDPWEKEELARMPAWEKGYDARTSGQLVAPFGLSFKAKKAWWGGWNEAHRDMTNLPTPDPEP